VLLICEANRAGFVGWLCPDYSIVEQDFDGRVATQVVRRLVGYDNARLFSPYMPYDYDHFNRNMHMQPSSTQVYVDL
jgi:hypothetical protein